MAGTFATYRMTRPHRGAGSRPRARRLNGYARYPAFIITHCRRTDRTVHNILPWPCSGWRCADAPKPTLPLTRKQGSVWADCARRKYLGCTSILRSRCDASKAGEPENTGRSETHPGGRAYYEGIFDGTGEEFCDWVPSFHRGFLSTSHEIQNCLVVVQGDRAASETYVEFNLLRAEGERHILVIGHGRYLDKWSQRDGRWAIDDRHFVG